MDDFLDSCESRLEALDRVCQVSEINKHANWKMHSWSSNDLSIFYGKDKNNSFIRSLNSIEVNEEKILGLQWDNHFDKLGFNTNFKKINNELITGNKIPTKTEFLAIIMSIFDPLGFLAPYTIHSRILMQEVWKSEFAWEKEIKEKKFLKWKEWIKDLELVKSCKIDRCYQLREFQLREAELHVFCDASSKAYAAVAYWRFFLSNDKFHTSFIAAKSRVTPTKGSTIPRLELQAALLATRLASMIIKEHNFKVNKCVYWSDSVTILCWIKKDPKPFKVFVANRLDEIRKKFQGV